MDLDEPQKPKRTKDGKQMDGPAYSTRSKAKLASHSGTADDSSGSQPHLPPPKRRTRQGEKQGDKNKGINNDDSAPIASNTTADECISAEIALRNDLVLETLFRYMNRSDLLSCRVVNKQWQYEATKEFRRRKLVIRLSFQSQGNEVSQDTAVFQDFCRRLSECRTRTPSLLSSFQVKADARNDLGSTGVGSILNTVGNQMKHLTLHLNYLRKWSFLENSSLMAHLHNLLFAQAPNLEFLEIKFDFPDHWMDVLRAVDSFDYPQCSNSNNELGLLPNLKTLIVGGTPPPMFLAEVINAAGVNLRSVGGVWAPLSFIKGLFALGGLTTSLRGLSSACIKYFLGAEGRDKIYLLKSFRVYLVEDSAVPIDDVDIELMEMFLTEHKKNLELETFECVFKLFNKDASFPPRIVSIINQILEWSSGSLTKLRIEPAKWFKGLLIIPRLPQLQEICFDCHCHWSGCGCVGLEGGGFFPPGFNMNHSFPNISSIVLLRCSGSFLRLFVSRMEIEMTEPVPSIRHITMIGGGIYTGTGTGTGALPRETDFHRVFPNLLSVSYVRKGKYYKIQSVS